MEWFKGLPEVKRWTNNSRSTAYGAKIIRAGRSRTPATRRQRPGHRRRRHRRRSRFPLPNFTGPARRWGTCLPRNSGNPHNRQNLLSRAPRRTLRTSAPQHHYFKNVEFLKMAALRRAYARVFRRAADLATGTLYIASNPSLGTHQNSGNSPSSPAKHYSETMGPLFAIFANNATRSSEGRHQASAKSFIISSSAGGKLHLDSASMASRYPVPSAISVLFRKAHKFSPSPRHLYRNDDTTCPSSFPAIRSARHSLSLFDHIASLSSPHCCSC